MDPQQPKQPRSSQHQHLHHIVAPQPSQFPQWTANSTPVSSPGLFSPTASRLNMALPPHSVSEGSTPTPNSNPKAFLHPLQTRKVRETYTAMVDRDYATGRKHINQYEVREEIGRGQHGKVKLARNLQNGENVAIKIIPRFSKKRRLGKVTAEDPQRNTKREIAILKKIRHPHVVALLEVIDDPELRKIYMVLEHVELGEITWRKKGLPHVCQLERRMVEKGQRGEPLAPEEEEYLRQLERKQALKDLKRAKLKQQQVQDQSHFWSLEYGPFEEDDIEVQTRYSALGSSPSVAGSRTTSQAPSRNQSARSLSRIATPLPSEPDQAPPGSGDVDAENRTRLRHGHSSSTALDSTLFGPLAEDPAALRARSPSMADSIISHMSSVDFNSQPHDPFADDFSYVPCFTIKRARSAFRDTVLGLEYLHYNGVVHRDIKPANLLWTKDLRVKISDFGVSYFGRPIRDGDAPDLVSESEALDFDDDRELSKTVGTPAFFAPELCYTDADKEQPRVSEQIDVWSLGVTLYCIIFARLPFMDVDEFAMFKKIATEDVYIPRRRLRPVDPFTDPTKMSLARRGTGGSSQDDYRDDEDASYELIDDDLYDLLKRMLIKNPEERIRLGEIKSHPWLLKDIANTSTWMDETDPSKTAGKRIEVNEKEIGHAVVPLTFLERARSAVKKAVTKVMHPRGDRADRSDRVEGSSRHRAPSSAASSTGDSGSTSASGRPRDVRRKSLRGSEDHLATVTQMPPSDHPLSQSVTASPQESPRAASPALSITLGRLGRQGAVASSELGAEPGDAAERQPPPGTQKPLPRHAHARSMGNTFLSLTPTLHESRTVPTSPFATEATGEILGGAEIRRSRHASPDAPSSRARSMDRAGLVFTSTDKHARPQVGLSTTVVPGNVQQPPRSPRPVRSVDLGAVFDRSLQPSPGFLPRLASAYLHGHPKSDSNMKDKKVSMVELEDRPATAHRIEAPPSAAVGAVLAAVQAHSRPQSRQSTTQGGRHESERQQRYDQHLAVCTALDEPDPARVPCPPSPNDDEANKAQPIPPSREETMSTAVSSSFTSLAAIATPMTSPSVVASPVCHVVSALPSREVTTEAVASMLAFQSDPSLPALLSGASSVSADVEGDFLGNPGVVGDRSASLIGATDSLTPPAPAKQSMAEFPLEQQDLDNPDAFAVHIDPSSAETEQGPASSAQAVRGSRSFSLDGDDEDSDSDEGLMMTSKKKKKGIPRSPQHHLHQHNHHHYQHQQQTPQYVAIGSQALAARRRDTNTSIGSTETAKKIDVHGDSAVVAGRDGLGGDHHNATSLPQASFGS